MYKNILKKRWFIPLAFFLIIISGILVWLIPNTSTKLLYSTVSSYKAQEIRAQITPTLQIRADKFAIVSSWNCDLVNTTNRRIYARQTYESGYEPPLDRQLQAPLKTGFTYYLNGKVSKSTAKKLLDQNCLNNRY